MMGDRDRLLLEADLSFIFSLKDSDHCYTHELVRSRFLSSWTDGFLLKK